MSNTHKGSWDRSDPMKKDQSEYWKPENVEKRRIAKEIHSLTKYEQAVRAMLDEQVEKRRIAKEIHSPFTARKIDTRYIIPCEIALAVDHLKEESRTKRMISLAQADGWKDQAIDLDSIQHDITSENHLGEIIEAHIYDGLQQARSDGWQDIHGGDHGAYWRGINPETGRCEKLPDKYTDFNQEK